MANVWERNFTTCVFLTIALSFLPSFHRNIWKMERFTHPSSSIQCYFVNTMDEGCFSKSIQLTITQRVDADHGIVRNQTIQHEQ